MAVDVIPKERIDNAVIPEGLIDNAVIPEGMIDNAVIPEGMVDNVVIPSERSHPLLSSSAREACVEDLIRNGS